MNKKMLILLNLINLKKINKITIRIQTQNKLKVQYQLIKIISSQSIIWIIQILKIRKYNYKIIVFDQNENFEGVVYSWYENRYNRRKTIKDCLIADFSLDQNYLIYSNQTADFYLIDIQITNQYNSETIKVKFNNTSCQTFNFLKLNSEKSILFSGNKEQMFFWKFCKEEDQAQLLLRILENNQMLQIF
ncbi:unnamed protein product [Paramecium pentaurelia]|uniref:Uncharacterized protein n=1 Tax=Paramecium pentaurelia TaxID=43138 RepID=A0A8S1XUQ4_9CILI|nr:unnamed protein product [Paramecium pentaurelia]